jgi:RsiW-degrading membrane proteinase PrsW (M82 family)
MEYSRSTDLMSGWPPPGEKAAHPHIAAHEGTPAFASGRPTESKLKLSLNVVFPLLGGRATWSHEHLLPIFVSLIVALMLMAVPFPGLHLMMRGKPAPPGINEAWQVFSILAVYIAFIINYYINQMCGRARSGLLQALVSVLTFWLLTTRFWDYWYDLFYFVIPAQDAEKSSNVLAVIAGDVFGTGLCEEGFKAAPLIGLALLSLAFAFLSGRTRGRLSAFLSGAREHFGLREPLDGIVLGAASGSGFFIYETLVQYVPQVLDNGKYTGDRAFDGLVELLARGLPELTAHSAYCGLFGYFIGLSVLRPGMAVLLIPLGWLAAAIPHGAWDATSDLAGSAFGVPIQVLIQVMIGVLSYALLAGAIFKARDISPSFAARCSQALSRDIDLSSSLAPATTPRSEAEEIRAALDRHWAASEVDDLEAEYCIYGEDAVLEYPQSGERIRGRHNIQITRAKQPGRRRFAVRRVSGSGDLWVTEYILTLGGKPSYTVSIMGFSDGKIARETQYFADPFEANAWHGQCDARE